MNTILEDKIALLPEKPGVYKMLDETGTVIYVGKAKVLKNRVRQYFQSSKNHSPKVRAMVLPISRRSKYTARSRRFLLKAI